MIRLKYATLCGRIAESAFMAFGCTCLHVVGLKCVSQKLAVFTAPKDSLPVPADRYSSASCKLR